MQNMTFEKGKILTGKQLREKIAKKERVWYREVYDNPHDKHLDYDGPASLEEAHCGYYIGNSDIEPDDYADDEAVSGETHSSCYGVYELIEKQ